MAIIQYSQTILADIASGVYDAQLDAMESAMKMRLTQVRRQRTSKDYSIGDKVVFNNYCGTKYLWGMSATVVGKKTTKVVVKLDTAVGRFSRYVDGQSVSSNITVPVSIIDKA